RSAGAPRYAYPETMSHPVKTVGLIGAGRMGMPLVRHLARKGFDVVVHDVDSVKRAGVEAEGGRWAQDLRRLSEESQAILVCVCSDKELREVLAPGGPLGKLAEGTIVAILSTVHPRTVVELSKAASERGVHVVDSTMCRGGKAADEGTLLAFVGGDAEVVAR